MFPPKLSARSHQLSSSPSLIEHKSWLADPSAPLRAASSCVAELQLGSVPLLRWWVWPVAASQELEGFGLGPVSAQEEEQARWISGISSTNRQEERLERRWSRSRLQTRMGRRSRRLVGQHWGPPRDAPSVHAACPGRTICTRHVCAGRRTKSTSNRSEGGGENRGVARRRARAKAIVHVPDPCRPGRRRFAGGAPPSCPSNLSI